MSKREPERRRDFDALFTSYSSDIVAYCTWRAASASDAQDAVAEVFLTAWRRLDELPEGNAARVWLYATARRVIANQRRASRRRFALQERLAQEAASASQEPAVREQAAVDQAADPANRLQTEVTVGPEGVVREIAVTWGRWTYTATYSRLGETAAPKAPANARDLLEERRLPARPGKR